MPGSLFIGILLILIILSVIPAQPVYSQENDLKKIEPLNRKVAELYKQKRYAEAIPIAEEILAIQQKELGPEHPETAPSLNNLGDLHRAVGDYSKAKTLFKKALKIAEKTLGRGHPGVAIILKNMAGLYRSLGDHEKAREIEEKALKILNSQRGSKKAKTEESKAVSKGVERKTSKGVPGSDDRAKEVKSESKAKVEEPIKGVESSRIATSYPYSIQLGSFRTLERVKKAISRYMEKDLSPYWVRVDLKEKGVWYRIFTGYFEDKEQAERFREKHGLKGTIIWKTPYAVLIGVYTSADELAVRAQTLKNIGVSPYVIKDQGGRSRLFVGAYATKVEAKEQSNKLKSQDVRSQIVKR